MYDYDIEVKVQSPQWKRLVHSNLKVLLTVGVVHDEFMPQGRTVNKQCYLEVMRRLHQKRDTHQQTHYCLCFRFETKNKAVITPQPLYSTDLAPGDIFPFRKLQTLMKRTAFCYD